MAHRLTSIPGASRYYTGSVVAYDNTIKVNTLGVPESMLLDHGAVSEPVVAAMAEGVRRLMHTTYALATSGIAGPDGGTEQKPVGTIWIACAGPDRTVTRLLTLSGQRAVNIELTTTYVLDLVRKTILQAAVN